MTPFLRYRPRAMYNLVISDGSIPGPGSTGYYEEVILSTAHGLKPTRRGMPSARS